MTFGQLILALVCAFAIFAVSLIAGSWLYFKLEDLYDHIVSKLRR